MFFYIFPLFFIFLKSITKSNRNLETIIFYFLCLFITLMIGLRNEIGGDWNAYLEIYKNSRESPWLEFSSDPIYSLINKASPNIFYVNTICAIIGTIPTIFFLRSHKNFYLSFFICFTYFYSIVGMGYTRQFAAAGLFYLAIILNNKGKVKLSILASLLASGFHSSIILLIPIIYFERIKNLKSIIFIITLLVSLFLLFFEKINRFVLLYLTESDLNSSGALYRTTLHLIASFTLILTFKYLEFKNKNILKFYFLISISSFLLLITIPSTTFVDRFLVYLIPLQAIIIANLSESPYFKDKWIKFFARTTIASVYFLLFFIWLEKSSFRPYWIPYKSIFF